MKIFLMFKLLKSFYNLLNQYERDDLKILKMYAFVINIKYFKIWVSDRIIIQMLFWKMNVVDSCTFM